MLEKGLQAEFAVGAQIVVEKIQIKHMVIQNLATTADKDYKEKIIDDLKILFEKLQKNVKIYLRSFYFGPYFPLQISGILLF